MRAANSRKKKIFWALVTLGLIVWGLLLAAPEESDPRDFVKAEVIYVIDGDTLLIRSKDFSENKKLRLIGIDTPESVSEDASKNCREGELAAARTKEIIDGAGSEIYYETDREQYDVYGRFLAYVYVKDPASGEYLSVEEQLLSEGLCKAYFVGENDKHKAAYRKLQDRARQEGAGFWGSGFY